jgi:hypothetical protein
MAWRQKTEKTATGSLNASRHEPTTNYNAARLRRLITNPRRCLRFKSRLHRQWKHTMHADTVRRVRGANIQEFVINVRFQGFGLLAHKATRG